MSTTSDDRLRNWAAGSYRMEAATELLIRAFNGRFVQPGHPWIHTTRTDCWIEFSAITPDSTGVYSGGERRVLAVAAALGTRTAIDLAENITGLDRTHAHLVLAALAHTMGTHHHDEIRHDPTTGEVDFAELSSLCPWPEASPSSRPAQPTAHLNGLLDSWPTTGTRPDRHAEPRR